ncbi:MAG: acetyl-CoA C-acyltransferase [Terriglobales bacterium]
MAATEVVILAGARTPMARYMGELKHVTALELGALAAQEAVRRSGAPPRDVDHVVMGNALQTSGDAIYGARHVGLKAGLPVATPALTVNRICGSGVQAIISAAQMIQLEESALAVAGGMESMSQAPHVIRGAREGFRLGQGRLEDSLMVALLDSYCGLTMAQTAEGLAQDLGIDRRCQDAYALLSQQRAAAAQAAGKLAAEIVPVPVGQGRSFGADDHLRPETTMEKLAALPSAFSKDGAVTAGNASGIVDGAAAVVVASAEEARRRQLRPLGRIVSWAVAGVEPRRMGRGPVPASQAALAKAGMALPEMDLIEVNEAFAAQYLGVERELGLDRERVNVNGGAIALGHPLGATGTRLVLTLLYELARRGLRYGLATACIGGGQGIAMIVERPAV